MYSVDSLCRRSEEFAANCTRRRMTLWDLMCLMPAVNFPCQMVMQANVSQGGVHMSVCRFAFARNCRSVRFGLNPQPRLPYGLSVTVLDPLAWRLPDASKCFQFNWITVKLPGLDLAQNIGDHGSTHHGRGFYTYFERKVIGSMQIRVGPNRVGPLGLIQPFADVFKLLFKEIILPTNANRFLFVLAPIITLAPGFCSLGGCAV